MREIKPEVQSIIDDWYSNVKFDIIHYWEQDNTWFVIIRYEPNREMHPDRFDVKLDFARIFPSYRMKDMYHISIDKTVHL